MPFVMKAAQGEEPDVDGPGHHPDGRMAGPERALQVRRHRDGSCACGPQRFEPRELFSSSSQVGVPSPGGALYSFAVVLGPAPPPPRPSLPASMWAALQGAAPLPKAALDSLLSCLASDDVMDHVLDSDAREMCTFLEETGPRGGRADPSANDTSLYSVEFSRASRLGGPTGMFCFGLVAHVSCAPAILANIPNANYVKSEISPANTLS